MRRIFEFASIFTDASQRGLERNGKLEGKVEVFERLFSIVEARPKQ